MKPRTDNSGETEHLVYDQLAQYAGFYESLGHAVFPMITMGTKSICNIDSYVFSSMQGTLNSIRHTLKAGRIGDSYALLRRFYDSAIINIYSNLYLEDNFSIETFIVTHINNWVQGKEQIPEFRIMSRYLRESPKLEEINKLLYGDDRYKTVRDRCNALTHYNYFHHVLLNDGEIHIENRSQWIDRFAGDAREIFILHLAYLFFLKDIYMMSSDYMDSMECGMTPEPDSQYWVAPFVENIFTGVLREARPDIAELIKSSSSMQLP